MREIITIGAGQCGSQLSYQFWNSLTNEHGIDQSSGTWNGDDDVQLMRSEVYFQEVQGGRFVPRSVLVDLEPGVLNQIRADQKMGKLFNPDTFIEAQDGAGNNWAKGYYTDGAEIVEDVLDVIRKSVEQADSLQGFQMMHSLGGGTGSGLGSLLLEKLNEEYYSKVQFNFSVLPGSANGGNSDIIVEPYNTVMAINSLIESCHAVFTVENSAVNRICQNNFKIKQPTFADINSIVSQVMSNSTATLRFPGYQNNCDIRKLTTNLVPFPRLHFITQSLAPLVSGGNQKFEKMGVPEISAQMIDSRAFMGSADVTTQGKILTATALYRGQMVSAYEAETSVARFKNKHSSNFVEWIPDNMMISVCKVPPPSKYTNISGTLHVNSTAQSFCFEKVLGDFDKMLKAKAYLHWYTGEGMDIDSIYQVKHNLQDLISEYQQYENAQVDNIDPDSDGEEFEELKDKNLESLNSFKTGSTMAASNLGGSL